MSPNGMRRVLVVVALGLAVLTGCSPGLGESLQLSSLNPITTKIEYRFNDSSVPPEHHRSYTVSAQADEASIVVDSYGDVLHDETAAMDADTWLGVVRSTAALDAGATDGSDDCTGGTSRDLIITQGDDDPVLEIRVSACGEKGQAEAAVVDAYVAPLLGLFDMERLLAPSD